jgi:hypothetical protein
MGLGIYAEHGNVYSRLDLDFNNDKFETLDSVTARRVGRDSQTHRTTV